MHSITIRPILKGKLCGLQFQYCVLNFHACRGFHLGGERPLCRAEEHPHAVASPSDAGKDRGLLVVASTPLMIVFFVLHVCVCSHYITYNVSNALFFEALESDSCCAKFLKYIHDNQTNK